MPITSVPLSGTGAITGITELVKVQCTCSKVQLSGIKRWSIFLMIILLPTLMYLKQNS